MKREDAEALKARLENEGILQLLNEKAAEMFGVNARFSVQVRETYCHDCFFLFSDTTDEATRQLTANKLLCSMFKSAEFDGAGWYFEEEDGLSVTFDIHYEHPRGGSNGLTLGRIEIVLGTKEVKRIF